MMHFVIGNLNFLNSFSKFTTGWFKIPRFFLTLIHKLYMLYDFSTHLYGRRLVLEWAEAEETLDDLRRKTAHSFVGNSDNHSQNGPPAKRAKTKSAIVETLQTL